MFLRLLILFTLLPLIELWLLIRVGKLIGAELTVGLVVVTGLVGAALARRQGTRAWRRVREDVAQARPPADALLDGLLILIAGLLLITPGLITDVLGFSLLVPLTRRRIKRRLAAYFKAHAAVHVRPARPDGPGRDGNETVIDTEFSRAGENDRREERAVD